MEQNCDMDYNDWTKLINQIRPVIKRAVFKQLYIYDVDVIKEIEQEITVKIYNKFSLFNKDRSLNDWVYIVSVNFVIDYLRKKRSASFSSIDSERIEVSTNNQIDHISVRQLLSKLPNEYRILLIKKYIQGFKQKEIAAELNLPIGTVGGKIQIGIKMLKTMMQKEGLTLNDF
jgi:RNA polymerase sigma-70 factor (ECF subfamily)